MKRRPFERSAVSEAVPPSEPAGTFARIYAAVRQIPAGKAATYGQIARLAGMPRCARMVGYALAACRDETVPCHRVVTVWGAPSPALISWPLAPSGRCWKQRASPFAAMAP